MEHFICDPFLFLHLLCGLPSLVILLLMLDTHFHVVVEPVLSLLQSVENLDELVALAFVKDTQRPVFVMLSLPLLLERSLPGDANHEGALQNDYVVVDVASQHFVAILALLASLIVVSRNRIVFVFFKLQVLVSVRYRLI